MRRVDWLIVVWCLCGFVVCGIWAFQNGVVAGRREIMQQYSHQVRKLDKICDHKEIKAMLSEGRR